MANLRRHLRSRLDSTISVLAVAILAACPQLASARPERDVANPVSTIGSEDIEDLPTNRDVSSILKNLPTTPNPANGPNPPPPSVNLRGISPTGTPTIDREQLESIPLSRDMKSIFDLHNTARAEVGSEPLRWNPFLAGGAQGSAEEQARTGVMKHAGYGERTSGNFGENLSLAPRSGISAEGLAELWFDEKQFFRPGAFPNICEGDWSQCGHYSQMIWSQTTDFGCGFARDRYVALVCRYSPPGNMFGQQVLGVPPNIFAQGPVIAINNPPQPAAPPQQPPPACQVPEPDDFIKLLNQAAIRGGYALGSPEPGDGITDRYWQNALDREQQVQDRLIKELATLQGNVAKHINDYLAAASAWQGTYAYISSTTTGLQGLLTNWLESREIYEKADLAFALANLGVGGVKLGFKAYKFFTRPRVAAAGAEAAAGATRVAGSADEAIAAAARGSDEGAALAAGETQAFNRTIVPPGGTSPTGRAIPGRGDVRVNLGADPNVPGFRGYTGAPSSSGPIAGASTASGASTATAASAEAGAAYARAVAEAEQKLAAAKSAGKFMDIEVYQYQLNNLLRQGASGYQAEQAANLARKVAELDQGLVATARQAGVNVDNIATTAADVEAAELALMRAIAAARGWHDIPVWAADPIANILINSRKILSGVADARISPQDLELLKSLKTYVESRGLNFAEYLATAAGEVGVGGKEVFKGIGGITFERSVEVFEGIVRYYDAEDINLLLKVLDAGGDAAKLRGTVNPVTQALLNGLGRATQANAVCGSLDGGLQLAGVGGSAPNGATAPGGRPTDAQLQNVLSGTGQLGQVGLGNIVDQFGVTDRFTEGQSLPRAMAGELWEFITSPATTTASFYYTYEAQSQYLDLLKNEHDRLVQLGTQLGDAARALRDLQATLQRAGLSGPGSYLGTTGPADLRSALDNLQSIYDSGSDTWKKNHAAEMDARRKHIEEKLAALAETVADLNALSARMSNVVNWLESLRRAPGGGLRGPVELFDPQIFVRLGSISLYLRGMGADAFGLTSDVPFRVVLSQPPTQPRMQNANLSDEDIERNFNEMRQQGDERARAIDEAPEVEVDPDFDSWLNEYGEKGD